MNKDFFANLSDEKKKKFKIIGIVAAVVIIVGIIVSVILVNVFKGKNEADTSEELQTTEQTVDGLQENDLDSKETDSQNEVYNISVKANMSNSWESEGMKFCQFDITVENEGDLNIIQWSLTADALGVNKVSECWNCDATINENQLSIIPKDYAVQIKSHESKSGIGVILACSAEKFNFDSYKLIFKADDGKEREVNSGDLKSADEKETEIQEQNPSDAVTGNDGGQNQEKNSDSNTGSEEGSSDSSIGSSVVTEFSMQKLHVEGTKLVNEQGQHVQLRGVSTHGLAWYPEYVNQEAFNTLKNDWHANCVRLAMYTAEYGGYCTGGDKAQLKQIVDNGVNYATKSGMYVIIDWHILSENNPNTYKSESIAFFDEMSKKYCNYNNVIYEICNEPINSPWSTQIKPYADEVISTIRKNDKDAVIIVGTNTWSQDVDDVIGNKIDDPNVMYALHFYAGTHKDNIRNKLTKALNNGVPVFVSECSICDASGNGGIDYTSANEWVDLLNSNGVSFIAWSLSNKNETSALISPNCSKLSGWSDDELSETGKWFKNVICKSP